MAAPRHPATVSRDTLIRRLADRLEHHESPRTALLLITTASGGAGFLASYALLHVGLTSMPVRYALAAVAGYLVFLAAVRLLAERYRRSVPDRRGESLYDATDLAVDLATLPMPAPDDAGSPFSGGGAWHGGGAGRAIDGASETGLGAADALDATDEGAVVVLPILLAVALFAGLAGTIAVVSAAPALLAEVLLDAAVATAIYRRVRRHDARHWTTGVLRRTWKPMLAIVVTLIVVAAVAQWLVPTAVSVGDLFRQS